MKTLKSAQAEARQLKHKSYRVVNCEYCNTDIMVNVEDDCEIELYNPVKVSGKSYTYDEDHHMIEQTTTDTVSSDCNKDTLVFKCPYCGHIHKVSRCDFKKNRVVGWDGLDHIVFELSEKETQDAREFMDKHSKSCASKQNLTLSEYFSYNITPTGLGDAVSIECNLCKAVKNITDYD